MEDTKPRSFLDRKSSLPPEWGNGELPAQNALALAAHERRYFILDDDPTGTQTVRNVPVLTDWSVATLTDILQADSRIVFLSTNSRALTEKEAQNQLDEILHNISTACSKTGTAYDVISRSDSTLRGHFPLDVDGIAKHLERQGTKVSGILLVPAFPTGGRYTLDGTQWVQVSDTVIPVTETAYSNDSTFGFENSEIRLWMREKSNGNIQATDIGLLDLQTLREGGPEGVARYLQDAPFYVVVDAISDEDLDVLVAGMNALEAEGRHYVVRSAASFIRAKAGLQSDGSVDVAQLALPDKPGLVVVGSHVPTTTQQINRLVEAVPLRYLVVNVDDLLCNAEEFVARHAYEISDALRAGKHVLIATQRKLVASGDREGSLKLSRTVSQRLAEIVELITEQPAFLIAKGGITSADVATVGLGLKRATVLGQLLPGIPVWKIETARKFRDLPYIIFPGNVGTEDSLLEAFRLLTERNQGDRDA